MKVPLNTLGLAHAFVKAHVKAGDHVIDATAGRGHDTVFLGQLVGPAGHVLAMDIQPEAVASTKERVKAAGFETFTQVVEDSHVNLADYADPESVDAILFNFGYLPGGDHSIFTKGETSIRAIEAGLGLLRSHGVMSLCIYHGGDTGYAERDALLAYLKTIDPKVYTVLICPFYNRSGDPPIPVFILKET